MRKLDEKHEWLKKTCDKNEPYEISITPTNIQSYGRGEVCLFYIKIMEGKITKTEKVADRVYCDFNRRGQLLGVEII